METAAPETKLVKALRTIFSFILAVIISILSMAICFNACFIRDSHIEEYFTDYEYSDGVKSNVVQYIKDVYEKNGLNTDNIDSIVTYEKIHNMVVDYSGYYITGRVGFDESLYTEDIDALCENIKSDIELQIKQSNQNNDADAVNRFRDTINDYIKSHIEITGIKYIQSIINIGTLASYAVIGVGIVLFIFVILVLYFMSDKSMRHISLRSISISFLTAGIFEICLGIIVKIISQARRFDVYPIYMFNQLMKYVNNAVAIVMVSGVAAIVISILFAAAAWKKKQK
ncbi:MAG: hypothetical protein NC397_02295 [Clostridium sp.]|nr:hypothetical protein [Clostridium sp.]